MVESCSFDQICLLVCGLDSRIHSLNNLKDGLVEDENLVGVVADAVDAGCRLEVAVQLNRNCIPFQDCCYQLIRDWLKYFQCYCCSFVNDVVAAAVAVVGDVDCGDGGVASGDAVGDYVVHSVTN